MQNESIVLVFVPAMMDLLIHLPSRKVMNFFEKRFLRRLSSGSPQTMIEGRSPSRARRTNISLGYFAGSDGIEKVGTLGHLAKVLKVCLVCSV